MQTLKKRPPGLTSLAKRSGFWGQNLRKIHPKPSQSDLGRFISADPIGFAGGLNLYSYSSNNPVGRVDPSGLDPAKIYVYYDGNYKGLSAENFAKISADFETETGIDLEFISYPILVNRAFHLGHNGGLSKCPDRMNLSLTFRKGGNPRVLGETIGNSFNIDIFPDVIAAGVNKSPFGNAFNDSAIWQTMNTIKHELVHAITGLPDSASSLLSGETKFTNQSDGSVMDYGTTYSAIGFNKLLPYSPWIKASIRERFFLDTRGVTPMRFK